MKVILILFIKKTNIQEILVDGFNNLEKYESQWEG